MKNLFKLMICIILITCFSSINAQNFSDDPDIILRNGKQVPKVMIVGTFHMNYPGLDGHITSETDKIDVLSDKRQMELDELADYIARFKPTKIVVEAGRNTGYLLYDYRKIKAGEKLKRRDETRQLGFRLLDRMKLDTLYGCDYVPVIHDMRNGKDSTFFNNYLNDLFKDFDWKGDDELSHNYSKWYKMMDDYTVNSTLLENFKILNSQKVIKRMHGAYLVGDFTLPDFRGADILAMLWYSRNLRIFRNIQSRVDAEAEDRILVLFGAGHTAILQEQFDASPAYDLVKFENLESLK